MQTKHIGGYAPFAMSNLFPGPILLSNAKRRLAISVRLGIVESYEESVSRLCRDFAWQQTPIVHLRRARGRPETIEVEPKVVASLRASNSLDVDLYAYGSALFRERS